MTVKVTKYKVGKYYFGFSHNVSASGKTTSESDCSKDNVIHTFVINNRNNGHVTLVYEDGSKTELFNSKSETTSTGVHWSDYTPEMNRAVYELV